MSIQTELVKVFDAFASEAGNFEESENYTLLPFYCTEIQADIQITLSKEGRFLGSEVLTGEGRATVLPTTIQSATRSGSAIWAYPLHEKVSYLAPGFSRQTATHGENDRYDAYLAENGAWANEPEAPVIVKAVNKYIEKGTIIADLKSTLTDEKQLRQLDNPNGAQSFVRFMIDEPDMPLPWRDKALFDAWQRHYVPRLHSQSTQAKVLDYISGEMVIETKSVESGIFPSESKAKLIVANDDQGYTYRGRFSNNEFYHIGIETAQKMNHALRWLIRRQSFHVGKRYFLLWESSDADPAAGSIVQTIAKGPIEQRVDNDSAKEHNPTVIDAKQGLSADMGLYHANDLYRQLEGLRAKLPNNRPINILVLDAINPGRAAIVYYDFLQSEDLQTNIQKWQKWATRTVYFNGEPQQSLPSFWWILSSAYQRGPKPTEKESRIIDAALTKMISALLHGRSMPIEVINQLRRKVGNLASYARKGSENKSALELTKRAWYNAVKNLNALTNYNNKGGCGMTLNTESTNTDYLFGRLLAILDNIEERGYFARHQEPIGHPTTAMRSISNFVIKPTTTWHRMFPHVIQAYLYNLDGNAQDKYWNEINSILANIGESTMSLDKSLGPVMWVGFADEKEESNRLKAIAVAAKARKGSKNTEETNHE
ncbi:type I-C CRISPR-associated protein Cas8c/Csd1 [Schleiferilactobacillus shenzhenensis]|uniref:Type I-C CRISPR-associated protein Cas8c/Csd1 n=1 Tax=Schleiferilactobacillus shenzhenensis LY-73 TaxID=1231336 RepID=U4TMN4_9LACO|nr:type I-C CRISPR-associated protein Cas8c/Csd1 [Schleiferilactobacillus shenzhenensis]ERL64690.1 hypothetical protein L248_0747 [Schleiferilactobacillus shenzhenensis LY-73]